MIGQDYEQCVRAVLAERLKLTPERIKSIRIPGATLPLAPELQHQIDLMYIHDNEVAEYMTIIECKYRSSGYVDQPDVQNLAFVRESVKAHKAMMVTNNGFTAGATAVADSQKIALLVVNPKLDGYDMTVVCRFASYADDRGGDILYQLLLALPVQRPIREDQCVLCGCTEKPLRQFFLRTFSNQKHGDGRRVFPVVNCAALCCAPCFGRIRRLDYTEVLALLCLVPTGVSGVWGLLSTFDKNVEVPNPVLIVGVIGLVVGAIISIVIRMRREQATFQPQCVQTAMAIDRAKELHRHATGFSADRVIASAKQAGTGRLDLYSGVQLTDF